MGTHVGWGSQLSVGPWDHFWGGERELWGSRLVLPPPVAQTLYGCFIQPR